MRVAPALGAALAGAVISAAAVSDLHAGGLRFARVVILGAALGALAYADLAEQRIPNRIVGPAIVGCGALLLVQGVRGELIDGLALVVVMLVCGLLWPASFGMGDVKLALLVVAGLGDVAIEALVLGLILAAACGAVLILRHGRSAASRSLPLAPFMAGGAAVVLLI